MRMGIVTAILCIHMLLWAGCNAASRSFELRSDVILLTKAQSGKIFCRKLLEETTSKLDASKAETTNISTETESNSAAANDTGTQNAEKADVKEENVVLDAKIETVKTDSAHQDAVKNESVVLHTSGENDASKGEGPKSQEASKEEQTESHVIEPTQVSDTNTTATQKVEETEDSTSEAITQSQVIENPTLSINEADAKVTEKGVQTEENAQPTSPQNVKEEDSMQTEEKQVHIPLVKVADVEENKGESGVDTQGKERRNVEEEVSAAAAVEEDRGDSTPKQKDVNLGDVKTLGGDQQEAQTEEASSVIKSTETKDEPTEDNPIMMVETDSNDKQPDLDGDAKIKTVQRSEPEDNDKGQIPLDSPANVEEKDSSDSADNSSGEVSKPSDIKSDDAKIEEKNDLSNDNAEIKEKKGEEINAEAVLQETSEETGEAKHESSDENREHKEKESEKKDIEEVPQVKSEEKAEENHEASEEKVAENHEHNEDNTEVQDKEGESNDAREFSQVKTDDETEAMAREVESQLEALKRDTVFDTTNDQRRELDPSDDEYDIIQELADLPTKFQETAGKVADHLRPDLSRWTNTSKEYFNLANQQISESFSPLIGKQYAPFFASMISYGILLLPLLVVILLFEHIKALFSLQKVLLFINIYLAAYFATLWLASFIIGLEPMSFFYHNSLSSYLSLQLLQALGYVVYLILQTANMINSCSAETRVGKLTSGLQWVVAVGIGLHYYVTVFHPAVASKPPHTSWKFYAIYSAAFFVLCLFARIRWVKKEYVSAGNKTTNKKS